MVRLVFRPYTQLRRSICTSELLRSSIRVSWGFFISYSFLNRSARYSCELHRAHIITSWRPSLASKKPQLQTAHRVNWSIDTHLLRSVIKLESLVVWTVWWCSAWSSVALPLGNRLESGCNIVFTHGARRAKVARSLIDARGVRMTHAEARLDPTNPPPLRIRSPRGPPWGGDHRSQVPCSWDIWT